MPEKPIYLPDDTAASEAAHHYYGANIKRMRRAIGQNREFLAAQAAHAAMVASHCACKKRPRALFDNSGEFKNGAHYAMRHSHSFHSENTARSLADLMASTLMYVYLLC
jgi:hypothetical protein